MQRLRHSKLAAAFRSRRAKHSRKTGFTVFKNTLTILYATLDATPIPGLKVAVGAILLIISTVEKANENAVGFAELMSHIGRLTDAIVDVGHQPDSNVTVALRVSLERFSRDVDPTRADLSDIANETKENTSHNSFCGLFTSAEDALVIVDLNRKLKESLDRFLVDGVINLGIQTADTRQAVASVMDRVGGIYLHTMDQRQSYILDRLRRAPARYDSVRRSFTSACLLGTREGLLSKVYDWAGSKDASQPRIFWLSGLAGAGKSTIAQTVAEHCHGQGSLGASFFLSRDEASCSDAFLVFSTIAHQLAMFHPAFKSRIVKALEDDFDAGDSAMQKQLQQLIIKPLQAVVRPPSPVVVVIDALDECSQELGGSEILRLLAAEIGKLPFLLKFFVTSRPESRIRTAFESEPLRSVSQTLILHDIKPSIVQSDIERFFRVHLAKVKTDLTNSAPWPTEKELKSLVERAGGLFIFASTAVKFIGDNNHGNPRRQLDILLQVEPRRTSLYRDLDALYSQILRRAIPDDDDEFLRDRFQTIVGTIVLMFDPLPLPALAGLLKIQPSSIEPALEPLHSIIVVPSSDDEVIRVSHPSLPDFLTHDNRCSDLRFRVNLHEHHGRLVLLCFDRMTFSLRRDICKINEPSRLNSELEDLHGRLEQVAPLDLRYACYHWASHLSQASPKDLTYVGCLRSFCDIYLLYWLELLSLLGRLELAIPSLRFAQKWLMKTPQPCTELSELLNDAQRFVVEFYTPIASSALHIYYSALPFTPKQTAIFRKFQHELKFAVRVGSGRENQWEPCLHSMEGHSEGVTAVAFSPDNMLVVSGSNDKTVRLWDSSTGVALATFEGHSDSVASVTFSPDNTCIVSGSHDQTMRIWDSLTGRVLATLEGHAGWVRSVAFSPDGACLASASEDGTVRLWDPLTWKVLSTLTGRSGKAMSIAFSPDSTCVASGYENGTVKLWRLSAHAVFSTLEGHSFCVRSVAFSPDGTRIVSGSYDRTACLWDPRTGVLLTTLKGHLDWIMSVAFTPDSTQIVTGSVDQTVRLWDSSTGVPLAILKGHSNWVIPAAVTPDGTRIISGSSDRTLRLWDLSKGTALFSTAKRHSSNVRRVSFSPDGTRIVSWSDDRTVQLWNSLTGAGLATLEGHSGWITSLAFSSDSSRIASGSEDKTVRLWNASTGVSLATLEGHSAWVRSVSFTLDDTRIISGSGDQTVRIWDSSTGTTLVTLNDHSGWVTSVAFSPDRLRIVSGSEGAVRVWDSSTGSALATLNCQTGWVMSVTFSPNGTIVVYSCSNGVVQLWDWASGANPTTLSDPGWVRPVPPGSLWDSSMTPIISTLEGHSNRISAVAVTLDGCIVSGSADNTVKLWDSSAGSPLATLEGHTDSVTSVAVSPVDTFVVSGSWDGTVRLWNSSTRTALAVLEGHSRRVCSVAFSHDGTHFVSGSDDMTIQIWNTSTLAVFSTLEGHTNKVTSVTFSPDGTHIVSGSADQTVRLWNLSNGIAVATLTGHSDWVKSVAFSPNGSYIISASSDRTARIWNMSTMTLHAVLEGHTSWLSSAVFSHDGARIATGSEDGTVRLWDFSTENVLASFKGHSGPVLSVAFMPDHTRIVSGSHDGTLRLWDSSTAVVLDTLRGSGPINSVVANSSDVISASNVPVNSLDLPIVTAQDSVSFNPVAQKHRLDGEWIYSGEGQRLCWVPLACRGLGASHRDCYVMGSEQGWVTIMRFSDQS